MLDRTWGEQGDAPAVARLRAAGAVICGKATTLELACGMPDPSKPVPAPRHPDDHVRWRGGSSPGSASGVAAGMFVGAIGSDTGGVRIRVDLASRCATLTRSASLRTGWEDYGAATRMTGFVADSMPIGLQIAAKPFDDDHILETAGRSAAYVGANVAGSRPAGRPLPRHQARRRHRARPGTARRPRGSEVRSLPPAGIVVRRGPSRARRGKARWSIGSSVGRASRSARCASAR